jgi:tRNA pseudouridine55 synthase
MDVHCSKGTYIRALCRDIGEVLGTGAVMSELERTMSGVFTKENAYSFEQIENAVKSGEIENLLMPADSVLDDFLRIDVNSEYSQKIKNGIRLRPGQLGIKKYTEDEIFKIYEDNNLLCLLKVKDCDGQLLLAMEKSFY